MKKKSYRDGQMNLRVKDWSKKINDDLKIRRRTCTTFIPQKPTKNEIRCGCNRVRRDHSGEILERTGIPWEKNEHTQSVLNNAYGILSNNHSYYIRCDIETSPNILAQLLFQFWNIKPPRLIMSIIGGAKYFKLNERLEREFIKGIIQVALKADAWMITPGFKTGVVQLVGEAIHDHKVTNPGSHITAIGCSKWGATRNREALVIENSTKNQHQDGPKNEKGQQDLEPNHTHFLLLDDGTYYNYELKDYRTRLVTAISSYNNANVPMVTLVVEGGPDTLSAICNDLRNDIPVVLVDGSGRVPNLLANFLNRTAKIISGKEKKEEQPLDWKEIIKIEEKERLRGLFPVYEEEIRQGLKDISKGSRTSDEQINDLFYYFLYCLQPSLRNRIQIFSLDSNYDLDDTIFEAIIQAKQKKDNTGLDREQLLQLALAWDAIEIAKEHIIKDDLSSLNFETKEKLFLNALILDRPQFVHTFIKQDFNITEMFYESQTNKPWKLKWEQLIKLYNDGDQHRKERLNLFSRVRGKNPVNCEADLDRILRRLIGDYMKAIYTTNTGRMVCCPWRADARVTDEKESEVPDPEEAKIEARQFVYRDLFLWSIFTNRIEMSKVILSQMETRICAALIASKVFKSYLSYASDNETKDILSSQANQFEEYANECLKSCYNYDEEKACEIAIRRINIFGGVTCLQVAVDADDKNFVGQPCCDQLLNNIWYDKMEPFQTTISNRTGLLLSLSSLGLLGPILMNFRKDQELIEEKRVVELNINEKDEEIQQVPRENIQRLNNNGINYSDRYFHRSNQCSKVLVRYFRHLKYFHQSPIVKYSYDAASYVVFLLLFSYYLLFDFNVPKNTFPSIHWTEILVISIVTTMLIEEIRQENRSMYGKVFNYFIANQFYNIINITSYSLFYIGLILRFTNTRTSEDFAAAKIVLAYDLEIWFIRSLAFLGIAQKLGPKLVMIRKMTIDLSFFTLIILIAMTAYAVASRTMHQYNEQPLQFDGRSIFRYMVYPTYYLLYGNIGNELDNLDAKRDTNASIATHILLAFHMLFVNILLINLLIAMFTFTFQSVQTQTDLVWRYERYSLIREYFDRPPLFPPLIFLTHFIEIGKVLYRRLLKHRKKIQAKTFKMIGAKREVDRDWAEFETYATNLYARSLVKNQSSLPSRVVSIKSTSEYQQSSLDSSNNYPMEVKSITNEMTSVKKALADLHTHSEEMHRCMKWMMDAIDRVKMSKEPKPNLKPDSDTNVNSTY